MKEIKINYSEYVLPEKPTVFYKIGKFSSELFGAKYYREDKSFLIKVENPELFLSNNKSFTVKNEFIGEETATGDVNKKAPETDETTFDIQKWNYKFSSETEYEINVSAQKRKKSQFETLYASLPDKWQIFFPLFTILILSWISFAAYALISNYPNPLFFWSAVGKYIQTTVSWSLFLLLFGVFIWFVGFYRGSIILKNFLSAITFLLAVIVPIIWVTISAKPAEFAGQPDENILYLNYLRNYFSTTSLILVGIVPWLVIFLKYFGFDLLPSLLSQAVKDKSK